MSLPNIAYTLRNASPAKTHSEAIVIGVAQTADGVEVASGGEAVVDAYGSGWSNAIGALGVTAKSGEVTKLPAPDKLHAKLIVLVGLGPSDKIDPDVVRRSAGAAARAVSTTPTVAIALPSDTPELVAAVVEGFMLGGYVFTAYKKSEPFEPDEIVVLSPLGRRKEAIAAFDGAHTVARAVAATREWINIGPGDLTPPAFAEAVVAAVADVDGVDATVFDEVQLAEMGAGGIIAVGKGSAAPPRLVELTYAPKGAVAHVALVGKGITFDSGGLTIKPGASMKHMKSDMSGAAAVVQATIAIARLGLPVQVSTFVPMAENMISGTALKPGDVVTHYGGTTVEATNMDAEGRLVLADALVRATEVAPDVILDVATLTGAMVMALGDKVTGVLGSDEVVADVLAASERAGEQMWPMPIPEVMSERIRSSKVADLAQSDWVRWGGGLYAAAFLREFTAGLPWAHLDIAGPSFNSGGAYGHLTPGGTGAAVATLVQYAKAYR